MFRQAEEAGYIMNVGTELEFYYFPDEHTPKPLDTVGYFDLLPSDSGARRAPQHGAIRISITLEKMSVRWSTPSIRPVPRSTASRCATPRRSPCPTQS